MGDEIGCHTAIVVEIAGRPRLVDVGFPIPVALGLDSERVTRTRTDFHTYVVRPAGDVRFDIERTVHPKRNMFTLLNRPVTDEDYVTATIRDYGNDGLFLDRVVFNKIIDGRMWRFTSDSPAPHFSVFNRNGYFEETIAEDSVVATVAHRFRIDARVLQQAYAALTHQND
jgi:hypothetical protein